MTPYEPSFNDAVQFTLVAEGVLEDNPHDAGGLTKFGITIPYLTRYLGRQATKADLLALTQDEAIAIYYKNTWLQAKIDQLPNELRRPAFDFAVNSGEQEAIVVLQRLIGVVADGDFGPVSQAKIAHLQAGQLRKLRNDYVTARGVYLMELVEGNADAVHFIVGWFKRVVELYDWSY